MLDVGGTPHKRNWKRKLQLGLFAFTLEGKFLYFNAAAIVAVGCGCGSFTDIRTQSLQASKQTENQQLARNPLDCQC